MSFVIDPLGCALLGLIAWKIYRPDQSLLYFVRRINATQPAAAPLPIGEVSPTPVDLGRWELLRRHGSEWKHEGWVRENSEAWQRGFSTPGLALRRHDGHTEEGEQ